MCSILFFSLFKHKMGAICFGHKGFKYLIKYNWNALYVRLYWKNIHRIQTSASLFMKTNGSYYFILLLHPFISVDFLFASEYCYANYFLVFVSHPNLQILGASDNQGINYHNYTNHITDITRKGLAMYQ